VLLPQYWEGRGARPPAASYMGPSSGFIAIRADIPAAQRFPLLLHEYVHVLTATRVPQAPAWLDEGLSEFWGASVIDRQQAVIGRPPAHHLKQLRARQWLTPDEIKQHQRGELEDNKTRTAMFYAQSWAMAHYLLLGRNPSAPLSFAPVEREWTPELDAGLRAYVTAGKFREVSAPAPEREATTQVAQPLSEARALAERANMVLFGERPDAALPLARKAVGLNPREPLALEVLGTYYFLRNQHAQSREWLTQALAADARSYTSAFYLALMSASPAERERYLQLAVAANPEQPVAWQRLWILYRGDGRAEHARRWCTRVEPLLQPWLWLGPSFNCEA
jgi:tetratricopeptide (TPR) repeat protein